MPISQLINSNAQTTGIEIVQSSAASYLLASAQTESEGSEQSGYAQHFQSFEEAVPPKFQDFESTKSSGQECETWASMTALIQQVIQAFSAIGRRHLEADSSNSQCQDWRQLRAPMINCRTNIPRTITHPRCTSITSTTAGLGGGGGGAEGACIYSTTSASLRVERLCRFSRM